MKKLGQTIKMYLSLEGSLFRYSLSFCLLLALLPTLIIGIVLFQNFVFDFQELLDTLYNFLPEDLLQPFVSYIMDKNFPSVISLVISLVVAMYIASKSFYSFILISATHESFKTKNILLRIKSFLMFTFFLGGLIVTGVVAHFFPLSPYILYFIVLTGLFYLLFRSLSFEKRPILYGMVGALFSTLGIISVQWLFFSIIKQFTSYQNVYGPLASLVIMFLSIYVVSSIIYFGYCLNHVYGGKFSQKEIKNARFYEIGERILSQLKRKKGVQNEG